MKEKNKKAIDFIFYHANALLIAAGICVIVFTTELLSVLNYVIAGALLAYAAFVFAYTSFRLKNTKTFTANLSSALVVFLAGIIILLTTENALLIIGTAWGLFGLFKGTKELTHSLDSMNRHEFFWPALAQAVLTISLAALLLYDPLHHIEFHMNVLGLEIIFSSMKAYKGKSSLVEKIKIDKTTPSSEGETDIFYPYKTK